MKNRPLIAITMGDPCGVGPEIAVKSLCDKNNYENARPLIIGDRHRLEQSLQFISEPLKINLINTPEEGLYEMV